VVPGRFVLASPAPGDQVSRPVLDAVIDRAPQNRVLPNYDTDRNDDPGLTLLATPFGLIDRRPGSIQVWRLPVDAIPGPVSLTVWVAPGNPSSATRLVMRAGIYDCDVARTTCSRLVRDTVGHDATTGAFMPIEFDLSLDSPYAVASGRRLELRIVALGPSRRDVLLGYDATATPSRIDIDP
jgi:hypothetical protein